MRRLQLRHLQLRLRHRLKASFTIEAAFVMPIVMLVLVTMICISFDVHDLVCIDMTANETAELYSHLPGDRNEKQIAAYGNERLKSIFSRSNIELTIRDKWIGTTDVILSANGVERVFHYSETFDHPQTIMRSSTIIEEVLTYEEEPNQE